MLVPPGSQILMPAKINHPCGLGKRFLAPNARNPCYSGSFCSPCTENWASATGAAVSGCPPPNAHPIGAGCDDAVPRFIDVAQITRLQDEDRMLRLSGFDVHPCKCTQGPQGSALQVSGIVTMQTGAPLDILETNSNVSSIVPQTRNRPELVGKIRYPKTVGQRFDPTAFA